MRALNNFSRKGGRTLDMKNCLISISRDNFVSCCVVSVIDLIEFIIASYSVFLGGEDPDDVGDTFSTSKISSTDGNNFDFKLHKVVFTSDRDK